MRDARVHRIGKSGRFTFYNRLNGAYSGGYGGGGPGELINTLNGNFNHDIQEYVCIGFDGFATSSTTASAAPTSTNRISCAMRTPSTAIRGSRT
jgi:hypothetical protein